ncbi:MAG: hypothetical protein WBB19_19175 [Desulforhopalus sp.]
MEEGRSLGYHMMTVPRKKSNKHSLSMESSAIMDNRQRLPARQESLEYVHHTAMVLWFFYFILLSITIGSAHYAPSTQKFTTADLVFHSGSDSSPPGKPFVQRVFICSEYPSQPMG